MNNAPPSDEPKDERRDAGLSVFARLVLLVLLALAALQFGVVVARSVFGETALWLQESVVYAHATLIALAIGWTLLHNRHVRIDAFKAMMSARVQRVIERTGLLLTVAVSGLLVFLCWSFVSASWRMLEGSGEVGGLPGVFLLKTLVILLFILLATAAFSRLRHLR